MVQSYERSHNRPEFKQLRRELRNRATPAEAKLWSLLSGRKLAGRKFRRQFSIGPYIVDFYCVSEKLAIELDGDVHQIPERRAYDYEREQYFYREGIRVLRFENRAVFEQTDFVLQAITSYFQSEAR